MQASVGARLAQRPADDRRWRATGERGQAPTLSGSNATARWHSGAAAGDGQATSSTVLGLTKHTKRMGIFLVSLVAAAGIDVLRVTRSASGEHRVTAVA
jgi:hypothetical protein